jgi:hypothetical protein
VFKVKRDEQGAVVKHKARLVVKGNSQRQGIDYEVVFARVARLDADWEVHYMYVKSAFLNGNLSEEVYIMQPPRFAEAGRKLKCWGWERHYMDYVRLLGHDIKSLMKVWCCWVFRDTPQTPAIYCRRSKNSARLVLGVYVDDLVITRNSKHGILKFKEEMKNLFKMTDLGFLHYYLGIEVKQQRDGFVGIKPAIQGRSWRRQECGAITLAKFLWSPRWS